MQMQWEFENKIFSKDCDDSSDEKNCRMVSFDSEKYLKNKPPPPPAGLEKLLVIARLACVYVIANVQIQLMYTLADRPANVYIS